MMLTCCKGTNLSETTSTRILNHPIDAMSIEGNHYIIFTDMQCRIELIFQGYQINIQIFPHQMLLCLFHQCQIYLPSKTSSAYWRHGNVIAVILVSIYIDIYISLTYTAYLFSTWRSSEVNSVWFPHLSRVSTPKRWQLNHWW